MEVIGTPDFSYLDWWVNNFDNIVYVVYYYRYLPRATLRYTNSHHTIWAWYLFNQAAGFFQIAQQQAGSLSFTSLHLDAKRHKHRMAIIFP